jgi:transposase
LPDWAEVAAEMLKPAVTLLLVWREYRDQHADGYSYSTHPASTRVRCGAQAA